MQVCSSYHSDELGRYVPVSSRSDDADELCFASSTFIIKVILVGSRDDLDVFDRVLSLHESMMRDYFNVSIVLLEMLRRLPMCVQ